MKMLKLTLVAILICLCGSQAFAIPDLYIDGSLATPAAGTNQDLFMYPNGLAYTFTLIAEATPWNDRNTFGYYTDIGTGAMTTAIFDQTAALDVAVGTQTVVDFSGIYQAGFFLFNDLDDDGAYEPGTVGGASNDVILFSERALTLPNPPGSSYQWFRAYNTYGYAHYQFDGLDFYGDYDGLIFIDDDHVTGGNQDHNDMVVGIKAVPEPGTLLLIGLGLTGLGILRRRSK